MVNDTHIREEEKDRRVILMQKMQTFSGRGHSPLPKPLPQWGGGHPLPTPHPLGASGASILTPPILKFCLRYWLPHPRYRPRRRESVRLTAAGSTRTDTVVLLRLDSGALERNVPYFQ